jgi:hypothetical protein
MLNAVVGGVAGAVTGGVAGWAQYEYFRTQDETAQRANNGPTFLKNESLLGIAWSTGQSKPLIMDCYRIAHFGKVAAEKASLRDTDVLASYRASHTLALARLLYDDSPDEELRDVIEQHVGTYTNLVTRVADIENALGTGCSTKVGVFRLLAFRRGWASGKSAHEMYENDKHNFHVLMDKSRALERCKKNTLSADEVLMLEAEFPICVDY